MSEASENDKKSMTKEVKHYKNIIVTLVAIIFVLVWFWFVLYTRTKIANYDVNLAHYEMSDEYDYCPYCGAKLTEGEE